MLREEFGVLALGQAGSNIGTEFEKLGYTTVYVNTSKEDLDTIKGTHKIHIPNADGAAKDRKRVLQLASEHIGDIVDKITSTLNQKYIIVLFSSSGGTGSGLSTPILQYLSQIRKVCVTGVVLPDESVESAKSCENSWNLFTELMSIKGLGATFLLDNSRYDKFAINSRFAKEFDTFISLKSNSTLGNMDNAERKQILSCPGVAVISKTSKSKNTATDLMHNFYNGIYCEISSPTAYYLGINTSNRSLDSNYITQKFSSLYDVFQGVSEHSSILIASGMQWNQKRFLTYKNKFEETVKNMSIPSINQHNIVLEPLQGLSFVEKQTAQPTTPINPRDILLGLLQR